MSETLTFLFSCPLFKEITEKERVKLTFVIITIILAKEIVHLSLYLLAMVDSN